jgi:hypothetical protein
MRRLRLLWLGALMIALVPPVARADDIAAIVRDYDAYARVQDPVRAGQRGVQIPGLDLAGVVGDPGDRPVRRVRKGHP